MRYHLPVTDCLFVKIFQGHGLLPHVNRLEDASVAGDHLADGVGYLEPYCVDLDRVLPGHPLLGRYDLVWW